MKEFQSANLAEEIYINALIDRYVAKSEEYYKQKETQPDSFRAQPEDGELPEHLAGTVANEIIKGNELKTIAEQLNIDETRDSVRVWYLNHIAKLMKAARNFLKENNYEIDYARFFGTSPEWWEE